MDAAAPQAISPDDEDTAKLEGQAPPKPTTIEIDGRQIPIKEIASAYDPRCKNNCSGGMLIQWRPNRAWKEGEPKEFRFAEICMCAIRRWRKANPPPLMLETDDVVAAIAAVDAAPAAPAESAPKAAPRAEHLSRLRTELSKQQGELGVILEQIGKETAPLLDQQIELDSLAAAGAEQIGRERARLVEIDAQLADYEVTFDRLRKLRAASEAAISLFEQTGADARAKADAARRSVELAGDRRREERRVIERKIEQVAKRIARIVERHPELADDR